MTRTSFITLQVLLLLHCLGEGLSISYQKKLEVQKHLKKLNKSPIKSIKSPDGDIIDCVDIFHQPAFDNPLLKNHTIQLRPSFHPKRVSGESKLVSNGLNGGEKVAKIAQLWQSKGKCPIGTIPIRRTKSEDVLRASSVLSYGKKNNIKHTKNILSKLPKSANLTNTDVRSDHEHAIAYAREKCYGAKATMNVWQPVIQYPTEFSLSQIWILAGSVDNSDLNSVEAGWQVSSNLYGDNNTRLFSYWTSDNYQDTGCYNLLCSGFIQLNNDIALGSTISPISSYAASQYDITLLIWKAPEDGNWWMQFGKDQVLGYWPGSLFPLLSDSASMVEWGGEVINLRSEQGQHTTTQMGSGFFPDQGFGKSSYFNNMFIVDGSNTLRPPNNIATFTTQSKCYDIATGNDNDWGNYFYYGGPGRNPSCP